jgi:acetone carboxylase gamma subunit
MDWDTSLGIEWSSIIFHTRMKDLDIFEWAYMTQIKGKWILSSNQILAHCGCGKSFQKKTGNPKLDAFLLKRSEHEKKMWHQH